MGQAKKRGSFEERVAQAKKIEEEALQKRKLKLAEERANETPTMRARRRRAQETIAVLTGFATGSMCL